MVENNSEQSDVHLLNTALHYYQSGDFSQADAVVDSVLVSSPSYPDALHLSGLIASQSGKEEFAIQQIIKAIQIDATPQMHLNLGVLLQAQGQLNSASNHYKQSLRLKPDYVEALCKLGKVELLLQHSLSAVECFQRAVDITPEKEAYNHLGMALCALGYGRDAEKAFRDAIALEPEFSVAYLNLGLMLKNQGNLRVAENTFRHVLSFKPESIDALNQLGLVLQAQNKLEDAKKCFSRILELNPQHNEGHKNLGSVYQALGLLEEAITHRQQAIKYLLRSPIRRKLPRKTLTLEPARQVLLIVRKLLGEAGISFFLGSGTLLGICRGGDLLPHDKDMDLGFSWDIDRKQVFRVLTESGEFYCPSFERHSDHDRKWMIGLVHQKSGIALDLFFYKPDGGHYLFGFNQLPNPILSRPRRFELKSISWQGVNWLVPDDCDQYLTDLYGSDWRTPDSNFDTVVSSRCQTSESTHARRCLGYGRLYLRLQNGQLEKAAGYCQQLLRHKNEPFLKDLLAAIDQQIPK
ncbi:tetratricopeptide repeat protein [Motiliproteus sp. MSK22-1]|uniref:tetratricopeptide repeat protein n=1 Tax=Motiliproteus sp. MSK22-1 TaxID=1897630 RepID=UPI0009759BA3|nr:tetratricopeptide repeat protein [Motiliproteus sp. MSK22-1]OMH30395.1 hypothetical protein BGP75_18640 [Motiliproteus sp. MSK22-1]